MCRRRWTAALAGIAAALSVVALVSGSASGAARSRANPDDPLGPAPAACPAFIYTNCVLRVGYVKFHINGSHIYAIGDRMSLTWEYELPPIAGEGSASAALVQPPGFKLITCSPKRISAHSEVGHINHGSVTCHYVAESATGWVTSAGVTLEFTGSNAYTANDYYAIIAKGQAIEGTVRDENVAGINPLNTGVPGAAVEIRGPGGFSVKETTNHAGFFYAVVPKEGNYTVTPERFPRKVDRKAGSPKPSFRKVSVAAGQTAEADFTIKSTLKLTVTLDHASVPADGVSSAIATVKATDDNGPVPGLPFSLRPFGGGGHSQSAWDMKVPATICTPGLQSRMWPISLTALYPHPSTEPADLATDNTGELKMQIWTGTVTGDFDFTVWTEDEKGKLVTKDVNEVSADATLRVVPPAMSTNDVLTALRAYFKANPNAYTTLTTDPAGLQNQLTALMSAGKLATFSMAPVVSAGGLYGLVVAPISAAAPRITVDPATGALTLPAGAMVIADGVLGSSALGGYWGAIANGFPGAASYLPTVSQWLTNTATSYSFPSNTGVAPVKAQQANPVTQLFDYGFSYITTCAN